MVSWDLSSSLRYERLLVVGIVVERRREDGGAVIMIAVSLIVVNHITAFGILPLGLTTAGGLSKQKVFEVANFTNF